MLLEKVLVHKTRKSYGKKGYLSKGFFPLQIKQRWSAMGNCYVRLIFLISAPKSSGYLSTYAIPSPGQIYVGLSILSGRGPWLCCSFSRISSQPWFKVGTSPLSPLPPTSPELWGISPSVWTGVGELPAIQVGGTFIWVQGSTFTFVVLEQITFYQVSRNGPMNYGIWSWFRDNFLVLSIYFLAFPLETSQHSLHILDFS